MPHATAASSKHGRSTHTTNSTQKAPKEKHATKCGHKQTKSTFAETSKTRLYRVHSSQTHHTNTLPLTPTHSHSLPLTHSRTTQKHRQRRGFGTLQRRTLRRVPAAVSGCNDRNPTHRRSAIECSVGANHTTGEKQHNKTHLLLFRLDILPILTPI